MKQSSSKSWLILLPVFGLMVYASLQLWKEYQVSEDDFSEDNQREILGYISEIDQNVKRKLDNSLLWDPVKTGDAVFRNDSIRTGISSSTKIGLIDKSELNLDENSLVVLESNPKGLVLDFKTGDFKTESKSKSLQIKLKDNLLTSADSSLRVRTASDQAAQIEVANGKAILKDAQGKELELNKQNFAKIDAQGRIEAQSVQVLLSSPEDKVEIIHPQNKINYPFTWAVLNTNLKQEVFELSRDEDFQNKYVRYAHQAIQAPLEKGHSYWRVGWFVQDPKTKKRIIKYTPTRKISLLEDKRLQLLFPENASSLIQSPGNTEIEFSWKSELPAKIYLLELSQTRDFRNIVKTMQVNTSQLKLNSLDAGVYYWRVSAFGENNLRLGQSPAAKFLIENVLPKAPDLIYPQNSFTWSLEEALRFEWGNFLGASSYHWILSKQMDFKSIDANTKTKDKVYIWKWQSAGEYFWKVRALNEKQEIIAESLTYRFVIEKKNTNNELNLLSPKDQSVEVLENTEPLEAILFEWQPRTPRLPNYKLQIADNPSFSNPIEVNAIKDTRAEVRLPKEATYFWKLFWLDEKDSSKNISSTVFSFQLQKNRNLPAVELSYPEARAELELYRDEEIKFEWTALSVPAEYRIVIEKKIEGDKFKTIVDRKTKELSYPKNNLSPGDYRWYIRAVDSSGIQGMKSEQRDFKILRDRGIAPPVINPIIVK